MAWGRVAVCVAAGLAAGLVAAVMALRPLVIQDFAYYWHAARLWLSGVDPYPLRPPVWPLPDPLYYPLPALLVVAPLAWLPQPLAVACFVGVPSGLLAWRLTRDGELWPLLALATPGYAMAVSIGQWAPWLMLAMVWPVAGVFLPAKPTLGLAAFLARPSRTAANVALIVGAVSLLVWPQTWPVEWLANLGTVRGHPPPVWSWLGVVLVATLALRWREPGARLLLAFACVPQLLFFADQAPLALIAQTKRQALAFAAWSWVSAALWHRRYFGTLDAVPAAGPYALYGCYGIALLIAWRQGVTADGRGAHSPR